jgi:uncharacterized protein
MVPAAFPYASASKSVRQDWIKPGERPGASLDTMREFLFDNAGVSLGILCGVYHASGAAGNFELWAALASAYNDWQIEHWLDPEPRLRGSVHVVADDPEGAAREIDRVAKHPQIVQVHMPTVTDRQYGDPRYRPIWEAAVRNDLVISFHHSAMTQTVLGYPRYFIEWHMTVAPHAAQTQIISLMCSGVFDKYPQLKAVFLEAGMGWLTWYFRRLDQQYKELRVEVPWVKHLPSHYLRENIRLSTQPMGDVTPGQFKEMIESVGGERIVMYSSDFPHYDGDNADVVFPKTLPDELRRLCDRLVEQAQCGDGLASAQIPPPLVGRCRRQLVEHARRSVAERAIDSIAVPFGRCRFARRPVDILMHSGIEDVVMTGRHADEVAAGGVRDPAIAFEHIEQLCRRVQDLRRGSARPSGRYVQPMIATRRHRHRIADAGHNETHHLGHHLVDEGLQRNRPVGRPTPILRHDQRAFGTGERGRRRR